MSTTPELIRKCQRCWQILAPTATVCPVCHALVHTDRLQQIAAEAKALESMNRLRDAASKWGEALDLLPPDANQADWIRSHIRELQAAPETAIAPEPQHPWAQRLGPLGPLVLLVLKGKSLLLLFKANFVFSLIAFMWVYWELYGLQFGVGFAILILIHEMGHFIDVRRRGLPADMPVFLPGLGAYVRWQAIGVTSETRAAVSLAGPFAGLLAAIACAVLWWTTGNPVWAALTRAGAWLNVLNLIPIWALDGGQAASALNKSQRILLLTAAVALSFFFHESVLLLVAAGAGYRLFTKDVPSEPSRKTAFYFLGVLAGLAVMMWLMPGHSFGDQP